MKTPHHKLNGVKIEMPLVVWQSMKVEFTRVMIENSTTPASIAQVRCATCQLVWSVAMQIAYANHLDINLVPYSIHLIRWL